MALNSSLEIQYKHLEYFAVSIIYSFYVQEYNSIILHCVIYRRLSA